MNAPASDLPARSPAGMAALDVFYSDFNDVNFYVEDDEQENLYEAILRKLFSRLKIVRIPTMSISHSDLMAIRTERSDAELSQCETVIDIRQELCLFSVKPRLKCPRCYLV